MPENISALLPNVLLKKELKNLETSPAMNVIALAIRYTDELCYS